MSHYGVDMCGEIPPCAFVPVPDTIVYGVSPIHSSSEMKYVFKNGIITKSDK
jgi:hypothetical protein